MHVCASVYACNAYMHAYVCACVYDAAGMLGLTRWHVWWCLMLVEGRSCVVCSMKTAGALLSRMLVPCAWRANSRTVAQVAPCGGTIKRRSMRPGVNGMKS